MVELLSGGYGVRTTVPTCKEKEVRARVGSEVDPGNRLAGQLGRRVELSNAKALSWEPRPVEKTIVDCGRSLIQ